MKITVFWEVGSLFYYSLSITRPHSVDDKKISECFWIGKDFVGSGRGLILRHYTGIRLEGLSKTTKTLNPNRW
jgi:hypothetical protein